MKIRILAAATMVLAALAVAGPVQAASTITNGFVNGQFDCTGCANTTTFDDLSSGSTALTKTPGTTEWTVTQGSVDWIDGYWEGPSSADPYSIDMNGVEQGQIEQTFATTAGATYQVSFELSGNPDGGTGTKTLSVVASGNPSDQYTFDVTSSISHSSMGWMAAGPYTFTATNDTTTLTFTGDPNAGAYGPVIADVVVTATTPPESASVTCTGSCATEVQSLSTRTTGLVTTSTSTSTSYTLNTSFGTGTLNCDQFVSGSAPADPLVVTTSSSVGGSVTLTFPASFFSSNPVDHDFEDTPVCFGANQRFPTWLPVRGSTTFAYQGLLFSCNNFIYQFLVKFFHYPLQACVSSYSWTGGAETVVIQTSSFGGDPMYW